MTEMTPSPRRSGRERKKPKVIYDVAASVNSSKSSHASIEQTDEEEPENADSDQPKAAKKKEPRKKRARPFPKSLQVVNEEKNKRNDDDDDDSEEEEEASGLFDAVKRPSTSLATICSDWQSRYQQNSNRASVEIINFLLQSCGGKALYVQANEALDEFDMNELVDYVVEDLEVSATGYPITSSAPGMKKFQGRFLEFWKRLIAVCCSSELVYETDFLERCIDWLTSLSSAEVRAIRHTSTVAAYEISRGLVLEISNLSKQLNLFSNKKSKKNNKKTSKQGEIYRERSEKLHSLVLLLFRGVFVHRYRDVFVELRVASLDALGNWLTVAPSLFLADSFLKYLGWMLNDKVAEVRLTCCQVLTRLYQQQQSREEEKDSPEEDVKMELFTNRFLSRYLELASDIDLNVVSAAIVLLNAVERAGLLDSEEDVSLVEKLVFFSSSKVEEKEISHKIRREAAEFVVLQYDAFGVLEETDEAKDEDLYRRNQTVALIEFIQQYLPEKQSLPNRCSLSQIQQQACGVVVDAFWNTPDCVILQDWPTLTSILLAEQHQEAVLTTEQQDILLVVMLASIEKTCGEDAKKKKEVLTSYFVEWSRVLLERFQAEPYKCEIICQFPRFFNLPTLFHHKQKQMAELCDCLKESFSLHGEEEVLQQLCTTIYFLFNVKNRLFHQMIMDMLEELCSQTLEKNVNALATYQKHFNSNLQPSKTANKKRKSLNDQEYALRSSLVRLKCLSGYFNLDLLIAIEEVNEKESLDEFVTALFSFFQNNTHRIPTLIVQWGVEFLVRRLLWLYHSILKESDSKNIPDGKQIQKMLTLRNELASLFNSILSFETEKDKEAEQNELKTIVFTLICDVKSVCIEEFEKTTEYQECHWKLPAELIRSQQIFFESIASSSSSNKYDVLSSLARSCLSNLTTSKRQAAALLPYQDNRIVQDFVLVLQRMNPILYLEVTMTSLRTLYNQIDTYTEEDKWLQLKELSQHISETLGNKKISNSELRVAFFKFICEGIRFAFSEDQEGDRQHENEGDKQKQNMIFLEVMRPFLSHCDSSTQKQVEVFLATIKQSDALEDQLEEDNEFLLLFEQSLAQRKKKGGQGELEIDEKQPSGRISKLFLSDSPNQHELTPIPRAPASNISTTASTGIKRTLLQEEEMENTAPLGRKKRKSCTLESDEEN